MEQQTPIPPKSRMNLREGQQRAIFYVYTLVFWTSFSALWRNVLK